jgi:hypothetical protein
MARVLKNKQLSRSRDYAMRQSDVCAIEFDSDVITKSVPVCYIKHTSNLTVSNYYIGQTGRPSQGHQLTASDFL